MIVAISTPLVMTEGTDPLENQIGARAGALTLSGIIQNGAGVTASWVKTGDELMIHPGVSCGHCAECLAGRDNMCDEYDIIGYGRDGGYAELVAVPGVNLIPKPKNLSWHEAAALPLVTLTAWHMLVARADVQPGENILVHAAGSGVGSIGIQIGGIGALAPNKKGELARLGIRAMLTGTMANLMSASIAGMLL